MGIVKIYRNRIPMTRLSLAGAIQSEYTVRLPDNDQRQSN